jgi:hypothetical protein
MEQAAVVIREELTPADGLSKREREALLMAEFDRVLGHGLTRSEASEACRRYGFSPQVVGGWARGGWLETNEVDGLRYVSDRGRNWLKKEMGKDDVLA